MNEKYELMLGGRHKLSPAFWKVGYSKGQERFIIEARQEKRQKLPDTRVQFVLMKDHFKGLVEHLSKKLRLYEEREGKIKPRIYKSDEISSVMGVWKPDEIYWSDKDR